jgi:putative ATP-dependent endonuclease of the OLD family
MRLRSVTVKNFRALVDVTVDLDETTVLIGENNTGKTSFLEALKLCLAQGASRRGDIFDDYDHHLSSDQAQIGDSGDTEVILRFAESTLGEWPPEVTQAISNQRSYRPRRRVSTGHTPSKKLQGSEDQ